MYRVSAYYISQQICEVPFQVILPLIFTSVVYYGIGLQSTFTVFAEFCVLALLLGFAGNSIGLLLGALLPGATAASLTPILLATLMIISGYFIPQENAPVWFSWVFYLNFVFYGLKAAILNQFSDVEFYCKADQLVVFSGEVICPDGERILASSSFCPITNGDVIISRYEADDMAIWQYALIILAFIVFFRALVYFALRFVNPRERELN